MSDEQPWRLPEIALQERVKELACLYGIAELTADQDVSLETLLQGITRLLPPAWQYPEAAAARIVLDGRAFNFGAVGQPASSQTADIHVGGVLRGQVEVAYVERKPSLDEGPSLREERHLIDAVARQIGLTIERRDAQQEKAKLESQLRHADRLATIGILAAGIAHELNEPLGNILGFAQLMKKTQGLPPQAQADLAKIESASLHAREIIRSLLVFARPALPQKRPMSLNRVVRDAVAFFKSRFAQENIELAAALSPDLLGRRIIGSPVQLSQVLVNLIVNALQAMPSGGKLTVQTMVRSGQAVLVVQDSGVGMSQEVQDKIFLPFFTTKDVGRGTGLGLSVAHGIVAAHGGAILVESRVGQGSRFEVVLPIADSAGPVKDIE